MPLVYEQIGLARDSRHFHKSHPHSPNKHRQALTLISKVFAGRHFVCMWEEKSFYRRAKARNNSVQGGIDLNFTWVIHLHVLQYLYFHICKHSRYEGWSVLHTISCASTHTKELLSWARLPGPTAGVSSKFTIPWCQDTAYMNALRDAIYWITCGGRNTSKSRHLVVI